MNHGRMNHGRINPRRHRRFKTTGQSYGIEPGEEVDVDIGETCNYWCGCSNNKSMHTVARIFLLTLFIVTVFSGAFGMYNAVYIFSLSTISPALVDQMYLFYIVTIASGSLMLVCAILVSIFDKHARCIGICALILIMVQFLIILPLLDMDNVNAALDLHDECKAKADNFCQTRCASGRDCEEYGCCNVNFPFQNYECCVNINRGLHVVISYMTSGFSLLLVLLLPCFVCLKAQAMAAKTEENKSETPSKQMEMYNQPRDAQYGKVMTAEGVFMEPS